MKTEQGTQRALEHFKRSLELDANRAQHVLLARLVVFLSQE